MKFKLIASIVLVLALLVAVALSGQMPNFSSGPSSNNNDGITLK